MAKKDKKSTAVDNGKGKKVKDKFDGQNEDQVKPKSEKKGVCIS